MVNKDNLEIMKIANVLFKAHNKAMLDMLNGKLKTTKHKHGRDAYKDMIAFVEKAELDRIKDIETPCIELEKQPKIISIGD